MPTTVTGPGKPFLCAEELKSILLLDIVATLVYFPMHGQNRDIYRSGLLFTDS